MSRETFNLGEEVIDATMDSTIAKISLSSHLLRERSTVEYFRCGLSPPQDCQFGSESCKKNANFYFAAQ